MDFQTIIIIVAIVLLVSYLVNRNQSRSNQQGNERPSYDDPNVEGRGSFGGRSNNQSNQSNRSNQGNSDNQSNRSNNSPGQSQGNSRNDSPDVEGHGGFGRDKD